MKDFLADKLFDISINAIGRVLEYQFERATKNPRKTQLKLLNKIIKKNQNTLFGQTYSFSTIRNYTEFKQILPTFTYDDLSKYIELAKKGFKNVLTKDEITFFATTSGSSGANKYIPITKELEQKCHQKVSRLFSYSIKKNYPEAFKGKVLTIVSPAVEGHLESGTPYGATSGMIIKNMPSLLQRKYAIPYSFLEIQDYQSKYFTILVYSIVQNVTIISSANPTTLILLAEMANNRSQEILSVIQTGKLPEWVKLSSNQRRDFANGFKPNRQLAEELALKIKQSGGNLRIEHFWKNLDTLSCWTQGNCKTFLPIVKQLFPKNININDLGYLASEVRGSICLAKNDKSGTLTIHENFFEFVKVDDYEAKKYNFLLCDELEKGESYYVFITDQAGLYRYNINDIIQVTSFTNKTPNIIFLQKGRGVTNITGEKLYEQQVMTAIQYVEDQMGVKFRFYLLYANLKGYRYELYLEQSDNLSGENTPSDQKESIIKQFDLNLMEINMEYKAKRKSGRLRRPVLKTAPPNSYERFKRYKVEQGVREGQFKQEVLTENHLDISPLLEPEITH